MTSPVKVFSRPIPLPRPMSRPNSFPCHRVPVVRLVNLLLAEASQLRATHITITPETDAVFIQFVIDGVAVDREQNPIESTFNDRPLASRQRTSITIKLLSANS